MVRSLSQPFLVMLLFAALLAPVLEAFDRWDSTPGLASDTEFHVAALAVVGGLIAAVVLVVVRVTNSLAFFLLAQRQGDLKPRRVPAPGLFLSGSSPPCTPLRI
jgi:hypothetical protein